MPERESRLTPVDPAALYLALRAQLALELGAPVPRSAAIIVLAQMALESGRFRSTRNYNLGGMKCPRDWPGDWQYFTTREVVSAAQAAEYLKASTPDATVRIVDSTLAPARVTIIVSGKHPLNKFCSFDSLESAVRYHVHVLCGRYRSAVDEAIGGHAFAFAQELHAKRYFTGDPTQYGVSVSSLAREYERTIPVDMPPPAPDAPNVPERPEGSPAAETAPAVNVARAWFVVAADWLAGRVKR
jgi:hypothetical protein